MKIRLYLLGDFCHESGSTVGTVGDMEDHPMQPITVNEPLHVHIKTKTKQNCLCLLRSTSIAILTHSRSRSYLGTVHWVSWRKELLKSASPCPQHNKTKHLLPVAQHQHCNLKSFKVQKLLRHSSLSIMKKRDIKKIHVPSWVKKITNQNPLLISPVHFQSSW